MDKYIHFIGKSSMVLMIVLFPIWMVTDNNPLFYNPELMAFAIKIGWLIALFISKVWLFVVLLFISCLFIKDN
jgi:hypothetical protein